MVAVAYPDTVQKQVPDHLRELLQNQRRGRDCGCATGLIALHYVKKFDGCEGTEEDAIDQLRCYAGKAGAQAAVAVACETPEGVSFTKNCWRSVACSGVPMKTIAAAASASVPVETEQP